VAWDRIQRLASEFFCVEAFASTTTDLCNWFHEDGDYATIKSISFDTNDLFGRKYQRHGNIFCRIHDGSCKKIDVNKLVIWRGKINKSRLQCLKILCLSCDTIATCC
jgi:hypothetical protein